MLLGAHVSAAGGLEKVFGRIREIGGRALQLFTVNQRRWENPEPDEETVQAFRHAQKDWGGPVAAHDSYLVNLASSDETVRERSVAAFARQLDRCAALSIPWLVTHPGSPGPMDRNQGLERYVRGLDRAIRESGTDSTTVLLENTAGQGNVLGSSFEELARVIELSAFPDRLGLCLDTCHAHAAGYALAPEEEYQRTMEILDRLVGLDRVRLFHLNDSRHEPGAGKDRHEHIGQGLMGLEPFRILVNDPRYRDTPAVIETPKKAPGKSAEELDRENLAVLRSLVRS